MIQKGLYLGLFPLVGYTGKFIKFSQQKNLIFHDR